MDFNVLMDSRMSVSDDTRLRYPRVWPEPAYLEMRTNRWEMAHTPKPAARHTSVACQETVSASTKYTVVSMNTTSSRTA